MKRISDRRVWRFTEQLIIASFNLHWYRSSHSLNSFEKLEVPETLTIWIYLAYWNEALEQKADPPMTSFDHQQETTVHLRHCQYFRHFLLHELSLTSTLHDYREYLESENSYWIHYPSYNLPNEDRVLIANKSQPDHSSITRMSQYFHANRKLAS